MVDLIDRHRPAPSATSDMPVAVTPPPAPKVLESVQATPGDIDSEAKAIAAAAVVADPAPVVTDIPVDPAPAAVDPPADPKVAPGVQKRFGELTEAKKTAEAERDAAIARANQESAARQAMEQAASQALAETNKRIADIANEQARQRAITEAAADPKPVPTQYDEPSKYDAALEAWAGRNAVRKFQAEQQAALVQTEEQRQAQAHQAAVAQAETRAREAVVSDAKAWTDKKTAALAAHPDFEAVAEGNHWQPSQPMLFAMLKDPHGAEVAYFLGKNPDEAKRLAAMPPGPEVFLEMGKISAKLAAKPAAVSAAPKPPPAPKTASASADQDVDLNALPMAEYRARKEAQRAAERERKYGKNTAGALPRR